MIGEIFGKWSVLSKGGHRHNNHFWLCRCECGVEKEISTQHLKKGKSTQCLKCSGKEHSRKMSINNAGMYAGGNRRSFRVKEEIDNLYETQKGVCPICNKKLPELPKCAWNHGSHNWIGEGAGS